MACPTEPSRSVAPTTATLSGANSFSRLPIDIVIFPIQGVKATQLPLWLLRGNAYHDFDVYSTAMSTTVASAVPRTVSGSIGNTASGVPAAAHTVSKSVSVSSR